MRTIASVTPVGEAGGFHRALEFGSQRALRLDIHLGRRFEGRMFHVRISEAIRAEVDMPTISRLRPRIADSAESFLAGKEEAFRLSERENADWPDCARRPSHAPHSGLIRIDGVEPRVNTIFNITAGVIRHTPAPPVLPATYWGQIPRLKAHIVT